MTSLLTRRVASVLLLLQVAYAGLLQIAFLTLGPDTAEIDHTDPSGFSPLNAGLALLTLVGLAGGAVLLGLERVRSRAPRALTVTWLALVGLGQTVLAVVALATHDSSAGIGLPVALLFAAGCAVVAVACALTIRTGSGALRANTAG
ncbi:hypothetical protein ACIQWZ_16830 [Streptomyces sp. NPDC098077]|uniref:hypothetical protein n=1 Tax=Streptomyces sp. NPDC098077 TaxID=3366093 RepID=UPI00381C4981